MGKGLIPADLETWKPRRRAIVPAFHKAYIEAMIKMFGRCTEVAVQKLDAVATSGQVPAVLLSCIFLLFNQDACHVMYRKSEDQLIQWNVV
jgi:hypothetical protein